MAIVKLSEGKYTGLSRDIKPSDAPIGSTFYEYDTEDIYDKALLEATNNGWRLRIATGGNVNVESLKNRLTVIVRSGFPLVVIKAGVDFDIFEINDIIMGEISAGRFVIGRIISLPFDSEANLAKTFTGLEL